MSYESSYYSARSRYYNACSEINSCQNRLVELKNKRQQKIKQINQLKTDIKNHQEALASVTQILKSETPLNTKLSGIVNKTGNAAANYISMVNASNVVSKDISDVYNNEMTTTKNTLRSIIDNLTAKKNELNTKILDLQAQLRRAETELEDIENKIRSTEASLQDWRRAKSNASIDMEYYSRKMKEAG